MLLAVGCSQKADPPALKDIATPDGYTRIDHYSSAGRPGGSGIPYSGSNFQATADVLVVAQCFVTSGDPEHLLVQVEPDQVEEVGKQILFKQLHGFAKEPEGSPSEMTCGRKLSTVRGTATAAELTVNSPDVRVSVMTYPFDKRVRWSVDLFRKNS